MKSLQKRILFQIFVRAGLFLFFLEINLRLGGFLFVMAQEYRNRADVDMADEFRILCLGASETAIGGKERYPDQLETILNAQSPSLRVRVINKGIPGITTAQVAERINALVDQYRPHVVTALLGANDDFISSESATWPGKVRHWLTDHVKVAELLVGLLERVTSEPEVEAALKESDARQMQDRRALFRDIEKKVEIMPTAKGFTELGKLYRAVNEKDHAMTFFKKAVDLDPRYYEAWGYMGLHYKMRIQYEDAVDAFEKAVHFCPPDDKGQRLFLSFNLADCYTVLKEWNQSEAMLKQIIAAFPGHPNAYYHLGRAYQWQGDYSKAIPSYQRCLDLDPAKVDAWLNLAACLNNISGHAAAEMILSKAIEINPQANVLYAQQGLYLLEEKKYAQAQQILLAGLNVAADESPKEAHAAASTDMIRNLIKAYEGLDNKTAVEEWKKKLVIQEDVFNLASQKYYRRVRDRLAQRGVFLIAVQYPNRSINILKQMLGKGEYLFYVDNQKSFEQALAQGTYYEYFVDRLGGDFGHFTPKGNRLLAENIADVIYRNILIQRIPHAKSGP